MQEMIWGQVQEMIWKQVLGDNRDFYSLNSFEFAVRTQCVTRAGVIQLLTLPNPNEGTSRYFALLCHFTSH